MGMVRTYLEEYLMCVYFYLLLHVYVNNIQQKKAR